jgi:hypothetical protein
MPDDLVVSEPALRPFAQRLRAWLTGQIETLYPGSFALVMATGIISNAFFFEARHALSDALFVANLAAYSLLVIFLILRALWFWRALWAHLINPRLVFSFFTIIAGTDVLGVGIYLRGFESIVRRRCGCFALISWSVLIYFSFGVLTFLNTIHGADVAEGGWLMAVVGTEVCVFRCGGFSPATVTVRCYAMDCTCGMGDDRRLVRRGMVAELSG